MNRAQSEHGMDDWQNERHYDKYERLTAEQWAWEFLRRNSEYKKRWEEFSVVAKKYRGQLKDSSTWAYRWYLLELCDPALGCFIAKPKWRDIHSDIVKELTGTQEELREFFGQPFTFTLNPDDTVGKDRPKEPVVESGRTTSPHLVIALDLRRDMTSQMNAAKEIFKMRRGAFDKRGDVITGFNNPPYRKFQEYLRLLDAKEVGADNTKIMQYIYKENSANLDPDTKTDWYSKIFKSIKSAQKHSDEYYKFLFAAN